jgi:hypothetical protein
VGGLFSFSGTVNLASIDAAIDNGSAARSSFGSVQNRLDHRLNNLATYEENLSASESSIKDVDMASEMTAGPPIVRQGRAGAYRARAMEAGQRARGLP